MTLLDTVSFNQVQDNAGTGFLKIMLIKNLFSFMVVFMFRVIMAFLLFFYLFKNVFCWKTLVKWMNRTSDIWFLDGLPRHKIYHMRCDVVIDCIPRGVWVIVACHHVVPSKWSRLWLRGTKPPCWDAKVALGQDQQKAYLILNGNFLCLFSRSVVIICRTECLLFLLFKWAIHGNK